MWIWVQISSTCLLAQATVHLRLILLGPQGNKRPEHCVLLVIWLDRAVIVLVQAALVNQLLLRLHRSVKWLHANLVEISLLDEWWVLNLLATGVIRCVSWSTETTSISAKYSLRFLFWNEGAAQPVCLLAGNSSSSSLCPIRLPILAQEALIWRCKSTLWYHRVGSPKPIVALTFLVTSILHI